MMINYTRVRMKASEVIDLFGGVARIARMLRIKPPSVSGWRNSEVVPKDKLIMLAPQIEVLTKNWVKPVTRKTLFPDDWTTIWPELSRSETKHAINE